MLDFSTVAAADWAVVAVLFLSVGVGKALSCESRILGGLLVVAVLSPGNFVVVALAWLLAAVVIKVLFQFLAWT